MIDKILSRPVTIVMCTLAVVVIGFIALVNLPLELMPSATFGEISIIYEIRGGVPPDKIENFVVKHVEDAVGDIDNLRDILSISKEGRAIIVLQFAPGSDMDAASIDVRERIAQIRDRLPSEVERPIIAHYQQDDVPIFVLGVTDPEKTAEEIREIVDDTVTRRIERIPGVANVDVFGGRERKIMIEVMPNRLVAFNLSMADVINALNRANVSAVAGETQELEEDYQIIATGRFDSVDDIANMGIAVTERGSIVRLTDIALIEDSFLDPDSLSRLNLQSNVAMYIQKETLARTVTVANAILEELELIREEVPEGMMFSVLKNDAEFIQDALDAMQISLILGAFLAAGVLIIFLKNILLTLIIFISIPVSVLLAMTLLYFNNVTLNVMTLGGLALGVGMLLDNSIVVIENIYRCYREKGSIRESVGSGVSEVFLPIMAGTVTTIIVFLPIIFLSATLRRLQGDMALAIMFSLLASLFASLTLVPFLYLNLGAKPAGGARVSGLYGVYQSCINRVLGFRLYFTGGVVVLFAASMIIFSNISMNLFETQEENKFTVHVELPTGANLDSSDEKVQLVENILNDLPEVKTISTRIEKWSSRLYVTLTDYRLRRRSKEEIMEYLRPKFEDIQPAFIYFQEAQEMAQSEVFIELYGYNYDILRELAMEVGGRMRAVEGLEDVKIRMREGRPVKAIVPDRRLAKLAGLSISDISQNMHARLRGLIATRFHEEAREIEVIVKQHSPTISEFEQMYRALLMSPYRYYVQLNQLAEFVDTEGPSEIWRKNKQRMVQVSATRSRISLERAVERIRENLRDMHFPDRYFYSVGGDYETMVESRRELFGALILTIILVYLVLGSMFESYFQPFIIMVAVPMSFIGVVAALLLSKSTISVGVIMGVIMLAGIVVNNSIMLVDRINSLRTHMTVKEAVMTGANQRLRPIIMTTITTILGLVPLALAGGEGSGLWRPLSLTVIGGLLSSTFLVLFGVPCIYLLLEDIKSALKKMTERFV